MVKRLDAPWHPSTKRTKSWLKLKKDYVDGLGDSLDLVPIGGWRGQGRKHRWISPWLMATYDPIDGTLGSVCRVMSGLSDAFYKENTLRYLGRLLGEEAVQAGGGEGHGDDDGGDDGGGDDEADDDGGGDDGGGDDGGGDDGGGDGEAEDGKGGESDEAGEGDDEEDPSKRGLLLACAADGVETGERCQFWFQPSEVWEIRGADVTISPVHRAAAGFVHAERGLSLRFPRFIRKRDDKRLVDATTPAQLADMYRRQVQVGGNGASGGTRASPPAPTGT